MIPNFLKSIQDIWDNKIHQIFHEEKFQVKIQRKSVVKKSRCNLNVRLSTYVILGDRDNVSL